MSLLIGSLNVQDAANGYWFDIIEGGPWDAVADVRGRRVLIPGSPGLYTPSANFEADHLSIRMHGFVGGAGSSHTAVQTSYASRFAALMTACAKATRADVTITSGSKTIAAGFIRVVGPPALGGQAREIDIEFEATAALAWS